MRGWQKAAWVSSWIAPVASAVALLALVLAVAAERQDSALGAARAALQISVLCFGTIAVLTHMIVLYRVHTGAGLTPTESAKLGVALKFGFGYADWRRAIRDHEKNERSTRGE
jgi:hypothetical protein